MNEGFLMPALTNTEMIESLVACDANSLVAVAVVTGLNISVEPICCFGWQTLDLGDSKKNDNQYANRRAPPRRSSGSRRQG